MSSPWATAGTEQEFSFFTGRNPKTDCVLTSVAIFNKKQTHAVYVSLILLLEIELVVSVLLAPDCTLQCCISLQGDLMAKVMMGD